MILGGHLGVIVVDGKSAESIGEGGGLRGLHWLSGECFLGFCLDSCVGGIDCPKGEGSGLRVMIPCHGVPMDVRHVESYLP